MFALSGRPLCVLVVVTPQVIAHQDARRLIGHLGPGRRGRSLVTDIAGVENMSGQVCPSCGQTTPLFPSAAEQVRERLAGPPSDERAETDVG